MLGPGMRQSARYSTWTSAIKPALTRYCKGWWRQSFRRNPNKTETPLRQSVPYAVAGAMSFKKPELLESVKKLQKAPRFEYNGDGRIVGVTMAEQKRDSRKEVNAERTIKCLLLHYSLLCAHCRFSEPAHNRQSSRNHRPAHGTALLLPP